MLYRHHAFDDLLRMQLSGYLVDRDGKVTEPPPSFAAAAANGSSPAGNGRPRKPRQPPPPPPVEPPVHFPGMRLGGLRKGARRALLAGSPAIGDASQQTGAAAAAADGTGLAPMQTDGAPADSSSSSAQLSEPSSSGAQAATPMQVDSNGAGVNSSAEAGGAGVLSLNGSPLHSIVVGR